MKNLDKKKKFLELRSKGYSFKKISELLKISERSLYSWAKEFEPEIKFLKSIERENVLASLNLTEYYKFKILSEELKKIEEALKEKNYVGQPLSHLLRWKLNILKNHFNFPSQEELIMNLYTDTYFKFEESQKQIEDSASVQNG